MILVSSFTLAQPSLNDNQKTISLVRIFTNNSENNSFLFENAEIVGGLPGKYMDFIVPSQFLEEEYFDLKNVTILEQDLSAALSTYTKDYPTLSEIEQKLLDISQQYQNITQLYSIGKSIQNRDIWCLEISTNPGVDESKPGVLFVGLHHAREWPTVEICLYLANQLTSQYGIDPEITTAVNNNRIWVVTCLNPDGYYYDHDVTEGSASWRKNRRYFSDFNTFGTDLNRNYPGSCNGDFLGMWGSAGISHHPSSIVFCGLSPLSEPETEAIKNLFLENDICTSISWHTYGELVLWPWGYTIEKTTPDNDYMAQIGEEIASRISKQTGLGTYEPSQTAGMYPTTGDLTDWLYGYSHYILGKIHFPYTIEACSSFHPSISIINQVCKENFEGALYLLNEAENISKIPVPVLPPVITDTLFENNSEYKIVWQQNPQGSTPEHYQLDELSNIYLNTDDASLDNNWILSGFSSTNTRSYSDDKSFKSNQLKNNVSAMTTKYPVPVKENMKLSFWCWYSTVYPYHKAFVEISQDGRNYHILDDFSGISNGWQYHEYQLTEYYSKSIYIRFRYVTDLYQPYEGFYVDDIYPVAKFHNISTVDDNLTQTNITISQKNDGKYYYQIRGFNSNYGWGDYSTLKEVIIRTTDNQPPSAPKINGPTIIKTKENYTYTIMSEDPDGDDIYYFISWDDNTTTGWIGPYKSGEKIEIKNNWSKSGRYLVKARAKDVYNLMGEWTTIKVSVPIQQKFNIFYSVLSSIFEHHPLVLKFLELIQSYLSILPIV